MVWKTLVFNQEKEVEEGNVKFIKISKENFMEELMQKLYENQIQSVLVEGGSRTLQTFIDQNLNRAVEGVTGTSFTWTPNTAWPCLEHPWYFVSVHDTGASLTDENATSHSSPFRLIDVSRCCL